MGFDRGQEEYKFTGKKSEVTRQIGNAALVRAALGPGQKHK